jgi:cysteine desulfurase
MMSRHYLDHASSTTLRPVALEAMLPYLSEHLGDPGRVHAEGKVTRVAIEAAREQVATLFGARPREVLFSATGTEAVNTAVWGALERGRHHRRGARTHIVTTAVEHSSVVDACRRGGGEITTVGVDAQARLDIDAVVAALRSDTALVSLQLANHEVGTAYDGIATLAAAARDHDVLVHIDACAAGGHLPVDFSALGVDLCSVTAHKLGGPKGAAALLIRRGLRMAPLLVGGAQERARRGGIENVAAIVGFGAAAAELGDGDRLTHEAHDARTRTDRLLAGALQIEGVHQLGDPDRRLPHLICCSIEGIEAEPILLGLDQRGVAVHSGSSCASESLEPSPVLTAMGVDAERSLRASVGWSSTDADIDAFLDAFPDVVAKLRSLQS